MIHGVVGNKFAPTEDQLTSTVWGLLEFLPPAMIRSWLSCARPWGAMQAPLRLGEDCAVELVFWPRTRGHGEPDLLLLARSAGQVDAVIIEAKHGAGKSQWFGLDEELASRKHDQLVRYWNALREQDFVGVDADRLRGARCTVMYLTGDVAPPRTELDESHRLDSSIRLAWLPWHDLDAVLADAEPVERAERLLVTALRSLLAHLGLTCFRGFRADGTTSPVDDHLVWKLDTGTFMRSSRWSVRAIPTWRFER